MRSQASAKVLPVPNIPPTLQSAMREQPQKLLVKRFHLRLGGVTADQVVDLDTTVTQLLQDRLQVARCSKDPHHRSLLLKPNGPLHGPQCRIAQPPLDTKLVVEGRCMHLQRRDSDGTQPLDETVYLRSIDHATRENGDRR
jgi:hypothetical protein